MPIVNIQGVGRVNFPDSMSREQINTAIEKEILPQFPEIQAEVPRGFVGGAKDIGASFVSGVGNLMQLPGQISELVGFTRTGDLPEQQKTGLQALGADIQEFGEEAKSPTLIAKEQLRAREIEKAEGFFQEAGAALRTTATDPALLTSFFAEQVPNLIGTYGFGILGKGGAKLLMKEATEQAMAKVGVGSAVAGGAVMQGTDVGYDTYQTIYKQLREQGVPDEEAQGIALSKGRVAAIEAAGLSIASARLPGGTAIERALVGKGMPGTAGFLKSTVGEIGSEAIEEGGGAFAKQVGIQEVFPETDLLKGVGAATALGGLGGALFGLPASFVNKANTAELERAKSELEEAKRKAAETLQPQNVYLALGYDPTVKGSGVYTPIIVNPDGTTIFPSERNQFAPTATSDLSEEGLKEKYGIASPEQIKDRTFDADRIRSFGISPKANLYKNKDVLDSDITNPQDAVKVKEALQDYLKKYPKANPTIRKNIEDYLARSEFQPLPVSETTTEITDATTTPEADAQALRDRMIKGFRDRPEIKKIYEEYDKFLQSKDVDKAALSAFNKIVSSEVLKGLGINPVATIYQDPEVLNADLSVPENADRVRARLMAFKDQSKSQKVKDNIDTYLNRTEFLTPQYIYDILNPPLEVEGKAEGQEQFVFIDPDGNVQSHYGTIVQRGKKRFAKYKDGERELTENVLVNPNPDQVEILELYKRKEKLEKEPDEFKKWMMGFGIDPSERADIGIDKRIPNRLFRKGGLFLDDLIRIAIEQQILSPADVDLNSVDGGVSDFRELIRTSVDGGFVPTPQNIRVMRDLESIQNNIEYLENKLKGAPEEAIAEEFTEPGAPKKVEPKEELVSKTVTVDDREVPITMNKTDERSGYSLVDVNVDAFEENFAKDKNFYVGPEGEGGIGKRYSIFTEFAKTAPSIEAPSVGIDENGRVMFDNGRHRYAYFRDKGLKTIPMSMSPESLENAKKFGYVGEKPKKTITAKDVLAGMDAKELELKNLPREGMSPEQLEVMEMADQIEAAGQAGFATAMRSNVASGSINQQSLDFYRERLQQYLSQKGQARSPINENIDFETFVEGFERDEARLRDQADFFGTKTSEIVAKSNDYIKRLAKVINDAGYKVSEINSTTPTNLQNIRKKIGELAGSTNRLMKQQEALDKGYQRADIEKYNKTVETLEKDFIEADELLGKAPQPSKTSMKGKAQVVPPVIIQEDNPGGNWLKNKRELSIEDGRKKNGVPYRFGSVTMYFTQGQAGNSNRRTLLIPVDVLAKLQGINDEQNNIRQKDLEAIKKIMSETGRLPQSGGEDYAPFINVYQDGTPYVNEGNHRIMAAKALGFKYIPVQVDYFNGAELENGVLTPEKAIEYDKQAHQEGFNLNNYSSTTEKKLGEEPQASKASMEGEPKAPKATAEQKKIADQLAKMKNGDVIYQDGDLALIRSYNSAGDAIYFPVKNGTVAMVDIDRFIGNWIPEADKQTLKDIKRNLEDARAKQRNDIVQFDKDGVGLSKDIDPKLAGVISEWKKLFKLNQRIYISTFEDVLANKDKFVGPYTRIVGEASRSRNDNGITAKLANGDRFILFQKSTSVTKMLETIAHEMGHAHQYEVYDNSSPEIKKQINAEYQKWLASQKGKSAKELLNSLRAKKTAETTKAKDGLRAEDLEKFDEYWSSFSEWYADQVARWATTSEKPLSVVDKFFAKIANGLRKIFSMLKNRGYLPNETFKAYMDYITSTESVKKRPIRPISEADQEPLFSRSTMKASFEGVDEAYAEAVRKQFTQEKATVGQKFESLKDNFFERMITGVFDEFRAIKKFSTEGYMMARLSKSIDGGLQGLLEYGQVYIKDGALDIRPNTKGLMKILEPLGTEVDQYQAWKALNRDAQMSGDKRSFDEDLVNGRNKLTQGTLNGKPRKAIYEQALKEENELNKSVLDVALQANLIDRAAYQRFSNDIYYIPFYKAMEDGSVDAVNASSKLTGQYFSKALKGGPKKTNDLMENVLLNWSHILSASMKNMATNKIIQDAEAMGVAERAKPMDGKYPANTIKFMENGKTVHFTLSDPDLVDAISTISYLGPKSAFLDIAKGFTNALRYGVTLSPAYKIRNLIRDSMSSAAVSELGPNMLENVYNGLRMSKKGDPTFMAALAGGGIFEMGTAHEGDQAKLIKRLIDKGIKETTILDTPEKIKGKLQDILNAYNELGNKFENANRLALYRKLRDSGKSHLEASFAARDLMDFSMQGQFRTVKVIASVVPFFNARLQGLYKLGRDGITPTYRLLYNATTGKETSLSDKQKAQRFMTMSSAIMLASILLYGIYKDDEDFQRREGWDRDNFWWFKIGDVAFRIPKPFEIGALGTIAERTYEQLADQGVEGKVFAERLNHILMDTFSLNPMPQMIKPLIDIYANKDSFTGAPIESTGMERLSKQERMTNKTSGVAIAMGGVSEAAAKVLTFNPDAQGISPIQMDYFIKAYLGWMGATIASTTDLAIEPFTEGTRVRKPVIDTLAMGFIKTEPETQSKYMTQFYENNAKLQSALADMRHYVELGDMEKVTKIMEAKGDKIALSKVYDKATKQLAELRKQSRIIENSKDISTEDKRAEMNRIKILMSDLARQMEEIRKSK